MKQCYFDIMIRLVPMSPSERLTWFPSMWAAYFEELLGAGFTPEEATLNVARNEKALCVDGVPNDDQYVFDVLQGDVKVGILWLAERKGEGRDNAWFVYDIIIYETFRGQGLGRGAMLAAEKYVMSRGATTLGLNVFGTNTVARHLYESLGYKAMAIDMKKAL